MWWTIRRLPGVELDGRQPTVLGETVRDREAAIGVVLAGGNREVHHRVEHEIGSATRPRPWELARRRQVTGIAFGGARRHPALDEGNLRLGETPGLEEIAEAGYRVPGRHLPRLSHVADLPPVGVSVAVGHERERRDLSQAMTRLAVRLEDANDLLVEGDGLRARRGGGGSYWDRQRQDDGGSGEPGGAHD
jgi:hypothetical protein